MNSQSFIATATPSLTTAESMESIIRPTSTFSSQSPLPTFPVSVIQTTATKVSTAATGTNQAPTATTSPEPQPKLFVWVIGSAGIILFIAVVVVVATVCTCCVVLRRRKRTRPNIKSNGMSVIVNEDTSADRQDISYTASPTAAELAPLSPTPHDNAAAQHTSHLYSTLRWNRHGSGGGKVLEGNAYTKAGPSTPLYYYPRAEGYFMGEEECDRYVLYDDTDGATRYSDASANRYVVPDAIQGQPKTCNHELPQKNGAKQANTSVSNRSQESRHVYQELNTETINYISVYSKRVGNTHTQ